MGCQLYVGDCYRIMNIFMMVLIQYPTIVNIYVIWFDHASREKCHVHVAEKSAV